MDVTCCAFFRFSGFSDFQEDMHRVSNEKAAEYIRSLPKQPPVDFKTFFNAKCKTKPNPVAIDLLGKMLVFDPARRISVNDALEHPYFAHLHVPQEEPVCDHVFSFDWEKYAGVPCSFVCLRLFMGFCLFCVLFSVRERKRVCIFS